ncbi:unnamed protein product [Brassicogethes aeneus]|uniref:Larval cuticle protein A2B n=1 Tax=Brassicogethes aeneus TaxID=1431903 RepID=A0A9P0B6R0_BRAAE|nr:unnamed protein product [Brassicogethes aeneus]
MAFKFVILTTLLAAAHAGLIGAPIATTYSAGIAPLSGQLLRSAPLAYATPIARQVGAPVALAKTVVQEEYDPNPQYSYGYDVQDSLTGDNKNQYENRQGDVVQGSYSLVDADGLRRTVDYTADPINGFNAVVRREPLVAKAVVAAPTIAKVATPIARFAAPLSYSAQLAPQLAYSAPIAKVAAPLAYSTSVLH